MVFCKRLFDCFSKLFDCLTLSDCLIFEQQFNFIGLKAYVEEKVEKWKSQIFQLDEVANAYPHEAFSVGEPSIQAKWTFLARVVPGVKNSWANLKNVSDMKFLRN